MFLAIFEVCDINLQCYSLLQLILNIVCDHLLAMIFSASVKAVSDLMDSSLDEEPPSKSSEVALSSLSVSVEVRDVRFSYTASGPTVLGGVNVDINKGTYIGIFGESGSGEFYLCIISHPMFLVHPLNLL